MKKVHLRVILKAHAKLKTLKFLEPAHAAPAGPQVTQASRKSVESPVLRLIPCAKDVSAFQNLGLFSKVFHISAGELVIASAVAWDVSFRDWPVPLLWPFGCIVYDGLTQFPEA